MSEDNYLLLRSIIDKHSRFVIIPHVNPDGDAMGSTLGLASVLRKFGKRAVVVSPNNYPAYLWWMDGINEVLDFESQPAECISEIEAAEVLIFLDFNAPTRLKAMYPHVADSKAVRVMIDHHPNPQESVDVLFSDTTMSSTCEYVFLVLQGCGLSEYLTKESAESLYTGIITDTGGLSYNSSRPETYYVVADLLKYGLDKAKVHEYVFNSQSFDRMQMLGYSLSQKMKPLPLQGAAYIVLSAEEQQHFNCKNGDTEGFVNYPLSIENVHISALILEKEDLIKMSFRSRGDFPVNEFSALWFGGGGHKNAAGGEFYGTLQDAVDWFETKLAEFFREWTKNNSK